MIDHSQYNEATFLANYFAEHAPKYKVLVDIGAKGIKLSNTYDLLLRGWKGLLVEPLLEHYQELQRDFGRLDVILENVAISDFDGKAKFYVHEIPGHSSLVRQSNCPIIVDTVTVETLLSAHDIPDDFDLISIDTEGSDGNIIRFMLEKTPYRPSVLIYEKGRDVDVKLIEEFYRCIHDTKGNSIYEKR